MELLNPLKKKTMKYYNKDNQEITKSAFDTLVSSGKRFHGKTEGKCLLTDIEETARDAEELVSAQEAPLEQWRHAMKKTDSTTPRWFEDYITENAVTLAPGKSKESYDAKVSLRSNKPL